LSQLCCVVVVGACAGLVAAVFFGLYTRFMQRRKEYQFFICHHKAGAGNFARLLKMCLGASPQRTRKVFVDSDDLRDLGNLFSHVASDTETLVVLCSREILSRPWCVGEITTANLNKVHVVKVILPDFQWPSEEFVKNYGAHVPEANLLAQHGLGAEDVKAAILGLQDSKNLHMRLAVDAPVMNRLVDLLFNDAQSCGDVEVAPSIRTSVLSRTATIVAAKSTSRVIKNVILADTSNFEARCTALVLVRLLTLIMQNAPKEIPVVLDEDAENAADQSFRQVCLICTNGVFRSAFVLEVLLQAAEMESAAIMPVVSEASFRFPTKPFLQELQRQSSSILAATGRTGSTGSAIVKLVERIFVEIAIEVNPQDAEDILSVRAQALAGRLRTGIRPLGLQIDERKGNFEGHAGSDGFETLALQATPAQIVEAL